MRDNKEKLKVITPEWQQVCQKCGARYKTAIINYDKKYALCYDCMPETVDVQGFTFRKSRKYKKYEPDELQIRRFIKEQTNERNRKDV